MDHLSKAPVSHPVFPQHPITFLSSRQQPKPSDHSMEASAKSPNSTCPTFPPDMLSNTCPSPERTEITHHARFLLQGGEAGQEGERQSLLQDMFLEHQWAPNMSLQTLTLHTKVQISDQMLGHIQDLVWLLPGILWFAMWQPPRWVYLHMIGNL